VASGKGAAVGERVLLDHHQVPSIDACAVQVPLRPVGIHLRGTMSLLSRKGVTPDMKFTCCDCGDVTTGAEVIDRVEPSRTLLRCECCQDDYVDQLNDY